MVFFKLFPLYTAEETRKKLQTKSMRIYIQIYINNRSSVYVLPTPYFSSNNGIILV